MKGLVVAGIGTDVGKTVVSAALCVALKADYWKPVLSGTAAAAGDDEVIQRLLGEQGTRIHPCSYRFKAPLSPHVAAAQEGISISLEKFELPESDRPIVVELAGGVLVPMSDEFTNMELVGRFDLPVVVVSRHYLGSINHTLLTLEALRSRGVPVMGVVFNGEELPDSERIIERMGEVRVLGRIPTLPEVTPETIRAAARGLSVTL